MKNKIRKSIAIIMSITIMLLFISGTIFIMKHQHHDCHTHSKNDICTVCSGMEKIQQIFQNLGNGRQSVGIMIIPIAICLIDLRYCTKSICKITPIDLKVRMDN